MAVDHPARATRPRRSMLYVPGNKPRALEKAAQLPADALIFDLEDAVLPEAKVEARSMVIEALRTHHYGVREKVIRINQLDSPWGRDDLAAVAAIPGVDAVVLPKVEDPEEVFAAESLLERFGAPKSVGLMAMIETPLGVLQAAAIARSSLRLIAFILGTNDLEARTGVRSTPDRRPLLTALSLCVLAARASNLAVIDGVHADLSDAEGFVYACEQGVDLGFDGKSVIHPSQLDDANAAFGPTQADVDHAVAVVEAFGKAQREGQGVTLLDGQLIEMLHVRRAERTLSLFRAIEALNAEID